MLVNDWKNATSEESLEALRQLREASALDDDAWEDELDELVLSGRGSEWRINCPTVDKLGFEAN